jgi:renalase
MKDFCIVGSGIAGSTIANLLSKEYSVEIFDKARGPGGRASNRRYKRDLNFDHGLQYISPKSKEFAKFILDLEKKKILKKWQGNHLDFTFEKKDELPKYIGVKGNNAIPKYLIKNIKTNFQSLITNIKLNDSYWEITVNNKEKINFKNLILTSPYPQLISLTSKYLPKQIIKSKTRMIPNVTVMLAYKNNLKMNINSIKFNNDKLAWAANENSKERFRSSELLWTIQCTQEYSKKIINLFKDNKNFYINEITKQFENLIGFKSKDLIFKNIHGWKYAYIFQDVNLSSYWLNKINLGLCADWMIGPKAEDAWLSAYSLYRQIKKNPPKRRV